MFAERAAQLLPELEEVLRMSADNIAPRDKARLGRFQKDAREDANHIRSLLLPED